MTLQQLREASGLSQRELGRIIGVSSQTVSNWEQNRSTPRLKLAQFAKLASVLPCTLNDLVEIFTEIDRIRGNP